VLWYTKAANQGNATAQFNMGVHFAAGRGVPRDEAKAREWYLKAAKQGYASAEANLGAQYMNGLGGAVDFAEAERWLVQAKKHGNVSGTVNLGVLNFRKAVLSDNDEERQASFVAAAECFSAASRQGSAGAQLRLGIMYFLGLGIPADEELGKQLLEAAKAQGNPGAAKFLEMIRNGITPDVTEIV
jgi:TPR repeat protein